ncbi:MAG TPA: zf-HC2 domain-containing protein [Gemmatimonadaceae bacterium]|nr:zf-HC2 domain-containing protein [Gemmatimonadaceae bacterium]
MNNCANIEIQEMLPDVLHGTLQMGDRERVNAHIAGCEFCREELRILAAVKDAAVFAPEIDANRVVDQIPPYSRIEPAFERPVRPRAVTWLVAAALAVVVAAGGSVLMTRGPSQPTTPSIAATVPQSAVPAVVATIDSQVGVPAPTTTNVDAQHSLALAGDMDGLSDGGLEQLMTEMNEFDGLPATEPEPVLTVDTVDVAGQD